VQTVGKITAFLSKEKIVKKYLPEIFTVTNHASYFTKQCQDVEENTVTVTCAVPNPTPEHLLAAEVSK
jgi:hypothetical protein